MPLITLTSEIGHQDYLVGAVKAQLLSVNPAFQLIDITHHISPFNYPQAAYICRSAFASFPPFTYHMLLVDLFAKKPERILLAFHRNQYILCADNGLLTMILEDKPEMVMGVALQPAETNTIGIAAAMGRVIHQLVDGAPINRIGEADTDYLEKKAINPVIEETVMEGQILFIDQFENVVVNITREQFENHRRNRNFKIVFKRDEVIDKISRSYADVPQGEKLALFNSAGYLEIAINKGNAAGLFGLKGYNQSSGPLTTIMQNQLFYQTVRIFFE